MTDIVLETVDLTKSYSGVVVLRDFNLCLRKGEIHALVGENGAGKSTLIQALVGAHRPDSGKILLNGKEVSFSSPLEANHLGISAVFQELSVVDNLSIAENVFINRQPTRGGFLDKKKMYSDTAELLSQFNMDHLEPQQLVGSLSPANKQQVEILKAVSYHPSVLILDEPTSSLTDVEIKVLFDNMRKLKQNGVSLIYISHHLNEIFEISDTITIMRDGLKVCDVRTSETDEKYLMSQMVGRDLEDIYGHRDQEVSPEVVVSVKDLTRYGEFENISFDIHAGEILAFAGLVGAGRTELGLSIFGMNPADKGEIVLNGRKLSPRTPQEAMENGIGYVTENRKTDGLFLRHSIRMNLLSNKISRFSKGGFVSDGAVRENAVKLKKVFNIVSRDTEQIVGYLSGGNQQKVMLANWFDIEPKILIIDEPTRGVDVGAKSEIYEKMRNLARTGTAIMMISSDLPEVLGMADRVVVMREGRISGVLTAEEATEESVLTLAFGGQQQKDGRETQ